MTNKKETVKSLTKFTLQTAAAIGSGAIAGAYIATAPFSKAPNILMKACIWIGGACLQDIVANMASKDIGKTTDMVFEVLEAAKNAINQIEQAKEDASYGTEAGDECEY